jgi:hypothetical protein
LKKRSKKTFGPAGVGAGRASAARSKSFLVLFFKKEPLALPSLGRNKTPVLPALHDIPRLRPERT